MALHVGRAKGRVGGIEARVDQADARASRVGCGRRAGGSGRAIARAGVLRLYRAAAGVQVIEVVSAGRIERTQLLHRRHRPDTIRRLQDDHGCIQAGQHQLARHRKARGTRRCQSCRARRIRHDLAAHHRLLIGVGIDSVPMPQKLFDEASTQVELFERFRHLRETPTRFPPRLRRLTGRAVGRHEVVVD